MAYAKLWAEPVGRPPEGATADLGARLGPWALCDVEALLVTIA